MLGLERAVVAFDDEVHDIVDQAGVARDRGLVPEGLRDDEVQVPVPGVAEDDPLVVTVLSEEPVQFHDGIGQRRDRERDVLDDDGRAALPDGADGGEHARADPPEARLIDRVVREARRLDEGEPRHGVPGLLLDRGEVRARLLLKLREKTRRPLRQDSDRRRNPRLPLDGPQRRPVHDFESGRARPAEGNDRRAGFPHGREQEETRVLHRKVGDGAQNGLRDERERAFGADQEMPQDLDGLLEVEKRVQGVSGGVLHPVLGPDPAGEGGVGEEPRSQLEKSGRELRLACPEDLVGVRVGGVHDRAGGEDEGQRLERVVAVLRDAATHAARVVGEDPAHHGDVDRGRIGSHLPAVGLQDLVDPRPDDAGLDSNPPAAVLRLHPAEVAGHVHEEPVGHGLAG